MFYIQQRIGCFLAFTDYTIISRSYHDWKMISNDNLPLLPRVLSIQSHTVHGYVGNKAAIFPLQCLGFHVDSIHTVSLSNHPGYAKGSKGKEIEPNTFKDIVQGLIMNDLISYDIVLSGYVRNKDILTAILETLHSIRQVNPSVIYICDSVLGDHGRLYVPSELVSYYREHVIPHASVITPNQFEAETLSRISIHTITDAFLVCDYFHSLGTPVCVLKGVQLSDRSYSMIISYNNNSSKITYRINLSKISNRDFSGCGDLCSAIIAGLIHNRYKNLTGRGIAELLEETSSLVHNVISLTSLYNSKELSIIEAAPYFIQTRNRLLTDSSTHSMTKKLTEELTEDSKDIPKTESVLSKSYRIRGGICGIIFDMDGTLTLPGAIDFSAMYRRTGLTRDSALGDIMSQIRGMSDGKERARARAIVFEEEMKGCELAQVRADVHELLAYLQSQRLRSAIATRNCDQAVVRFLEKADLSAQIFAKILHRESLSDPLHHVAAQTDGEDQGDGIFINKPDARVAEHILNDWQLRRGDILFVGDSLDDMLCGRRSGCVTCLVRTNENEKVITHHRETVDYVVDSLVEIIDIIHNYK